MNLLLGADSLATHRSGVGRMTLEIATALRAHPAIAAMRLLVGADIHPPEWLDSLGEPSPDVPRPRPAVLAAVAAVPGVRTVRDALARRSLGHVAARLTAANGHPTLYYEPNMIARPFPGPMVAGFNDLSWLHRPEAHPADRLAWIARRLPDTLARADRFVAISAFTARAMAAELGIPAGRIDVVPLAPSAAFHPIGMEDAAPILARLGLPDRGYILSVSTLEPRKNFDGLLAAWRCLAAPLRARFPLVIVGARGWGDVLSHAEPGLIITGHVPDADLAGLYARSAVFAYVSLYEGFGLPVLEAMAAGAPVIASATTACGETAGPAAVTVDPTDVGDIAAALTRMLSDAARAEELRARGRDHAARFTWANTAGLLTRSWARALGR